MGLGCPRPMVLQHGIVPISPSRATWQVRTRRRSLGGLEATCWPALPGDRVSALHQHWREQAVPSSTKLLHQALAPSSSTHTRAATGRDARPKLLRKARRLRWSAPMHANHAISRSVADGGNHRVADDCGGGGAGDDGGGELGGREGGRIGGEGGGNVTGAGGRP